MAVLCICPVYTYFVVPRAQFSHREFRVKTQITGSPNAMRLVFFTAPLTELMRTNAAATPENRTAHSQSGYDARAVMGIPLGSFSSSASKLGLRLIATAFVGPLLFFSFEANATCWFRMRRSFLLWRRTRSGMVRLSIAFELSFCAHRIIPLP